MIADRIVINLIIVGMSNGIILSVINNIIYNYIAILIKISTIHSTLIF